MKIAIIGGGAMGSLFGALLTYSGEEVWVVDISREHISTIQSVGLTFEEEGKIQGFRMKATTDVASVGKADLVLLFVKTYHTEKALSDALILEKEDTVFLTFQNGLGNEEVLCKKVDPRKVMLGVTGHGATLVGPGHILHAGKGKSFIGELDHQVTDRAREIARILSEADIETEVSANIHDLVWEKLLVNVGINALTALTGLKNGQLLEHPETVRLMEALVTEAAEVAVRKGIRIEGKPIEKVKAVAEATMGNRSSMGQDFDYRRRTEIEVINGAIIREAERFGIPVPCNLTITDLIRVIERRF
jgi:2-dehydropantoate 2-reductase